MRKILPQLFLGRPLIKISEAEEKIPPKVFGISDEKSVSFHEPRVGTDTTGPGEAIFSIG